MSQRRARSIAEEMGRAELGDTRLSKRVAVVAQGLVNEPGVSLPKAMKTEADLEGAYRLLSNEEVEASAILRPHVKATAERVIAAKLAYAIGDTTEARFGGESRHGLGPLQGGGRGFLAHVVMALAADGSRLPLGILSLEALVRKEQKKSRKRKKARTKFRRSPDRESLKWLRGVKAAEEAIDGRAELIHLMDADSDIFDLMAEMRENSWRFIARVSQNRAGVEETETGRLFAGLAEATVVVTREIQLAERRVATKGHPKRRARLARLSISARALTIARPEMAPKNYPEKVTLNFVRVFEENPPHGEEPVEWKLVTSEPIDTPKALERIVDGYRTRWVIEELFKALKTGCGLERSQLESLEALLNLLAIQLPVACQLLALRALASEQKRLAREVLSAMQLKALTLMTDHRINAKSSVADAFAAIARLGAHITNNGPPGWLVLGRGFADLIKYEAVLIALKESQN